MASRCKSSYFGLYVVLALQNGLLKIDTLQLERQQFESQNLKLELEKYCCKEEHEHLTVENEQLKVLYEELLKKIEEEGAIKPPESDKVSETAPITQQVNV